VPRLARGTCDDPGLAGPAVSPKMASAIRGPGIQSVSLFSSSATADWRTDGASSLTLGPGVGAGVVRHALPRRSGVHLGRTRA
jgi:hypothetical protein